MELLLEFGGCRSSATHDVPVPGQSPQLPPASATACGHCTPASVGSVRMRAWPSCGVIVTATVWEFTSRASGRAFEGHSGTPLDATALFDDDKVLLTRGSTVLAARFDAKQLRLTSEPVAVFEGVRMANQWDHGAVNLGRDGTLAYVPGEVGARQRWVRVMMKRVTTA